MTPADNTNQTETSEKEVTPSNPTQVKKAVALGKDLMKKKDVTKACPFGKPA